MIYRYDGAPPSVTYRHVARISSAGTTHTHTSVSFGAARSDRKIIVPVVYQAASAGTVTCTIGGVTAAAVSGTASTSGTNHTIMFIADVPTGTSGSVVLTFSVSASASTIIAWSALGLLSSTRTDFAVDAVGLTQTLNLDVAARGVAVGMAYGSDTGSWSWSGMTEYVDQVLSGPTASGASYQAGAAVTPLSVLAVATAGGTHISLAASFR